MIDWRIIIFIVVLAVLLIAAIDSFVLSAIRERRAERFGRRIDVDQAIRKHKTGQGRLVRNLSSMPGDWWYIDFGDWPNRDDLLGALGKSGYIVAFEKDARKQLDALGTDVENVGEPFDIYPQR